MNFKLDPLLTFKSVLSIRALLYEALIKDSNDILCLDLSNVTHCDSAGLALLIEVRKLCKKHNKIVQMVGMSSEIQSLAEFCGVKSILETI